MSNPIARLLALALAGFLILTYPSVVEGRQLSINVYVEGSPGKALVVGYVDDASGLSFLESSQSILEDNGQIYAICDSLVEEDGSGWILSFPASGFYGQYHASFLVSGGFAIQEINCSDGLEILSAAYNDSIILDVQGFDLTDPAVSLRYARV